MPSAETRHSESPAWSREPEPVNLKVFKTDQMSEAGFSFRRHEDASPGCAYVESHEGLTQIGLYYTVAAKEKQS
jgi:hypothetical protein